MPKVHFGLDAQGLLEIKSRPQNQSRQPSQEKVFGIVAKIPAKHLPKSFQRFIDGRRNPQKESLTKMGVQMAHASPAIAFGTLVKVSANAILQEKDPALKSRKRKSLGDLLAGSVSSDDDEKKKRMRGLGNRVGEKPREAPFLMSEAWTIQNASSRNLFPGDPHTNMSIGSHDDIPKDRSLSASMERTLKVRDDFVKKENLQSEMSQFASLTDAQGLLRTSAI